MANAIYAPENADKLEAAFKNEIRKVITEGFTAQEVEEAKKAGSCRAKLPAVKTTAWQAVWRKTCIWTEPINNRRNSKINLMP